MPPKTHNKTRTPIFNSPFPHLLITDFLSPELYKKTFQIYNKLQFKEKTSDLFHFFQTNELNEYSKLDFFRAELDKEFWQLEPMKSGKIKKQDTFYSVFASYYFAGDYLLCHDDIVEDRIYAFSYYLEDHPSGDLVFFNKEANKQVKRIKVKKNTLAIFEVSDISYHEVDYTKEDGRKAITGWFNIKGLGSKRKQKTISPYVSHIPTKNILQFPIPKEYYSEEYFQLMDIQYQFNVKKTTLQGPFFQRRTHKIELDQTVVFVLEGYKLFSAEFYKFETGDYILLNDPVNTIKADEIIDIFVTHLPEQFEQSEDQQDVLIKIAQPDEEASGIPEIHDSLFVVNRGKKQYYVDRVDRPEKQFMLAHFIYVKDNSKKNSKSKDKKVIIPAELKKEQKVKEAKNKGKSQETKQPTKTKQIKKQNKKIKRQKVIQKPKTAAQKRNARKPIKNEKKFKK